MKILEPFSRIGRGASAVAAAAGRGAAFAGSVARAGRDVRTWLPLAAGQARKIGVDSLPLVVFIAAFTGVVLALQSSYAFTGLVPLYFVGTLVGKSVILELGPVLTGLVLAGRVGANIAAEIGTMRVTEQIDALEMLAYDPLAYLAVPRVAAATFVFPLVVAVAIAMGIAAGWLTSIVLLDLSTQEFVRGLRSFHRPFDITFALVKSASFGAVVAGVGAFFGYRTRGGAEGVGRSTTRAVVAACMLILLLDAFWAVTLL
jgi:phospholipid/cholesterol/gamma-HCH transport system permease protein